MAKKKKASRPGKAASGESGKVSLNLRLDAEVHEGLKRLSEESGVSLNQLLNGIGAWAARVGHPGEPERNKQGLLTTKQQPGCVWFGHESDPALLGMSNVPEDLREDAEGAHFFTLDFTVRRVIREDE